MREVTCSCGKGYVLVAKDHRPNERPFVSSACNVRVTKDAVYCACCGETMEIRKVDNG